MSTTDIEKTTKSYWDSGYETFNYRPAKKSDCLRKWIELHVPPLNSGDTPKSCLEIGCFPGTYLGVFAELGYQVNGVDYCNGLDRLPNKMEALGHTIGNFWQDDFFKFDPGRQFDLVCSFGFIEHFTNYQEVITKHASLVRDGGTLIIAVPNFFGKFQHWAHMHLDSENYERHYIPSMEIETWREPLADEFDILFENYFGRFNVITEDQKRPILDRALLKTLKKMKPVINAFTPANSQSSSPYGGIIAQKR